MIAAMYSAERLVGFAEAHGDVRPQAFHLEVLALADDTEVALGVAERSEQGRRVEHEIAEHAAASRFLGRAQAKPIAGIAQRRRRALDQGKRGGVGDAAVGIDHVQPSQAHFLEEIVGIYAVATEVGDDPGRQARIDLVGLGHAPPIVAISRQRSGIGCLPSMTGMAASAGCNREVGQCLAVAA
jgi:hypothetical protein